MQEAKDEVTSWPRRDFELRGNRRVCLTDGKRAVRVKGYEPDHIRTQRGENEGDVHYVEKSEKQKSVRQKAAPDDELSMSAEIQKRVRSLTSRPRLPNLQQLFGASRRQTMALKSCHNKTDDRPKEK
jgi:hypothetical protein